MVDGRRHELGSERVQGSLHHLRVFRIDRQEDGECQRPGRFLRGGKKHSRCLDLGRVQSLKGDLPIDHQEVELRIGGHLQVTADQARISGGIGAPWRRIRDGGELSVLVPVLRLVAGAVPGIVVRTEQRPPWPGHATRDGLAEEVEQLTRRPFPAVAGSDLASRGPHAAGEIRIAQHRSDALRDLVGMSGHEAGAAVVQDLAVSAALGGDHRPRGRRCFERHHSKRLALRSVDADGRPRVDVAQRVLVDAAAEHHSPIEAETARHSAQVLLLGPFADDPETAVR